jgi:hypothetical protein
MDRRHPDERDVVVMTVQVAADAPAVLDRTASEVGARSGALLRQVAAGDLALVKDCRLGQHVALLVGPRHIRAVLEFLHADTSLLGPS